MSPLIQTVWIGLNSALHCAVSLCLCVCETVHFWHFSMALFRRDLPEVLAGAGGSRVGWGLVYSKQNSPDFWAGRVCAVSAFDSHVILTHLDVMPPPSSSSTSPLTTPSHLEMFQFLTKSEGRRPPDHPPHMVSISEQGDVLHFFPPNSSPHPPFPFL